MQRVQHFCSPLRAVLGSWPVLREPARHHGQRGHLCCEGFCGGHGVFAARIQVHSAVGCARNQRADLVDDGKARQQKVLSGDQRAMRVLSLARLRNDQTATAFGRKVVGRDLAGVEHLHALEASKTTTFENELTDEGK